MAKIVLATFGSLGDLNPKTALALELKRRGHAPVIAAMEFYRDAVTSLGIDFMPMRPHLDPMDRELAAAMMDPKTGTRKIIGDVIMANLRPTFDDLKHATVGADLLVTGEMAYVAASLTELTGIKWISTSLSPISFFSAEDPPVAPGFEWFENLRFLGKTFHKVVFDLAKNSLGDVYAPYREFRRELGLDPDHDPIFTGKFSSVLHLAMFSKALAKMQPDWPSITLQSGFAFFDEDLFDADGSDEIDEFLNAGEPPVVFTLGSAAAMVPGDFFDESIRAARKLGCRAILLYGKFSDPPAGIGGEIAAFNYAPYSKVFPHAACVVHQGGVGTTGQALRAGVPQVIVPFANDQADNAARCRRAGYGEIIRRHEYNADTAAAALEKVLGDPNYKQRSFQASRIIAAERGTATACDAIEAVLNTPPKPLK